ncbi:PH domain-containing protein [Crenobacter caeni]|uniref:PH domain-containing protein n=1 Tax=Crenobacter caeni TaxID=2705474 RepID=A0A6B2KNL1_9NEIS|nr:PH domain-containing protein [Crenobacter caeni]NDV11671.1 PH domain-containing protein [Crenobacter caeni]
MGLMDALLGNAKEISAEDMQGELAPLLAQGERVQRVYKLVRDMFVFTDKRLILIDKQGLTGSKVEYHSIPYRSITHFSLETAGTFDMESELKLWVSGMAAPIQKNFGKKMDVHDLQSVLAAYVLR